LILRYSAEGTKAGVWLYGTAESRALTNLRIAHHGGRLVVVGQHDGASGAKALFLRALCGTAESRALTSRALTNLGIARHGGRRFRSGLPVDVELPRG